MAPSLDRASRGPSLVADAPDRRRTGRHRGLAPDQEAMLDLQRLAGNTAVLDGLQGGRSGGLITSVDRIEIKRDGMDPEKGIQAIREQTKKSTLALTQRGITDDPPLFRTEAPQQAKGGWTAKALAVSSIGEPQIHEFWPKAGLHKLADGSYVDVTESWAKTLEQGEDEHRDDAILAWQLTWKKVQDTINRFAREPGPVASSPEAATKALWRTYVAELDPELRPNGDLPSDAKQREVLAVKSGTFFAHTWETTIARDTRNNHETLPDAAPREGGHVAPKDAMVTGIKGHPDFKVPGPSSEELIAQVRKKWVPGRVITDSKLP